MLENLAEDRTKIPSPTRSEMMNMFIQANNALKIDRTSSFKSVWVLNDESEDYLVSKRCIWLLSCIWLERLLLSRGVNVKVLPCFN